MQEYAKHWVQAVIAQVYPGIIRRLCMYKLYLLGRLAHDR